MVFHLSMRIIWGEASSRLIGPGPQWLVEPRDTWCFIFILTEENQSVYWVLRNLNSLDFSWEISELRIQLEAYLAKEK